MLMSNGPPARQSRVSYLDSVRGIAATVVLFHHGLLTFPPFGEALMHGIRTPSPVRWATLPPFSLLWNGPSAVLIFFALSGFVLALMLSRQQASYPAYAVKRFCRIYLPYAAAVAVGMLLMSWLRTSSISGSSDWFRSQWSAPVTADLILHHIFMTGKYTGIVDSPVWSLIHELRVSLIFPLLLLLVKRVRVVILAPILLAPVAAKEVLGSYLDTHLFWLTSLQTASYLFLFAAGAYLALHRNEVAEWVHQRRPSDRALLWIFAAGALSLRLLSGGSRFWWARIPLACVEHFGAVALLLLLVGTEAPARLLGGRTLVWYGGTSYSLYLTHVIVILSLVHAWNNGLTLPAAVGTAMVLAVLVAVASYYFLERPSMAIGRILSDRIALMSTKPQVRAGSVGA